ncbi:hypothetical protein HFN01_16325 [Rhizobium leguminosarum]|uniref:hypothetical protein n=1 Tax=Rhizobium leguminosarum TaxID=384 RepID=UPI001C9561F9|nr:hypothetical protein [Rhizobium leguminosarum]MBY5396387.1 hypothetical protein [Rhizobium leguminosarum]
MEKSKRGEDYQSLLGGSDSELVKKLYEIGKDYLSLVAKTPNSRGGTAMNESPYEASTRKPVGYRKMHR